MDFESLASTPLTRTGAAAAVLLFVAAMAAAGDEKPRVKSPYLPEESGTAIIQCQCILGTSGCSSDFFWHLAGSPTHSWSQEIHLMAGKETDLDHACYRKRDVEKLGAGLCCDVDVKDDKPDDKQLRRFFGVSAIHMQDE